jgi:hypothetical protein
VNPDDGDDSRLADRTYEGFHRKPVARHRHIEVSPLPQQLAEIGELEAVAYRTTKGNQRATWEHEFGEEGGRKPILAVDPETDRLHIAGGDYRVEDRGIVD